MSIRIDGLTLPFDSAAMPLAFESFVLRCGGGFGLASWFGYYGRLSDQSDQTIASILAVSFLSAEAARIDNEHPIPVDAPTGQAQEALTDII
jgi:hypothetical protein